MKKIPLTLFQSALLTSALVAQAPVATNRAISISESGPAATGNVLATPPTLRLFDFDVAGNDGASLDGWVDTIGVTVPSVEVFPGDNDVNAGGRGTGGFQNGSVVQDSAHPSGVMSSPPFMLQANMAIQFQIAGGQGSANLPANLAAIPANSDANGFQGMGLRRLSTNAYVLHGRRNGNGNGFQDGGWSIATLAGISAAYPGELFVLDWIDSYSGGWGFGMVDNVRFTMGFPGGNAPLVSPPALIAGAPGYDGTLAGTLNDTFGYNPLMPTNPLPNQAFGAGIGFHNNSSNGSVILIYDLATPVLDGAGNQLVVDLYGRDSNKDRDNNIDVAFLDAGGVVLGEAKGLAIPDTGAAHLRVSSNGRVPDGSTVAKIRVTGNDSDGAPAATNNFTLMEIRAAELQAAYDGTLVVAAVNGSAVNVGQQISLASGALLTLNANGDYSYDPNGAFNPSGAPAADSFSYTINYPSSATVSVSIIDDDLPVYVDDNWAGLTNGDPIADADAGTAGNQPAVFGTNAFATLQAGLLKTNLGGKLTVNAGAYNENVGLSDGKTLVITGSDAAQAVSISNLAAPIGSSVQVKGSSVLTLDKGSIEAQLSGGGSLVKNTANTLSFNSANSLMGPVTLNGGTLAFRGAGDLGTGAVAVNNSVTFQTFADVVLGNAITSAVALTKSGPGSLSFEGNPGGITGPVNVTAGRIVIPAGKTLGGSANINSGAGIGGEGTIAGNLALGTLLGTGATLVIDENTPGVLAVSGTLTLNSLVNVAGATTTGQAIDMISYGTTLDNQSGAASLSKTFIPVAGGRNITVDTAKTLQITLANPESIVFTAAISDKWEVNGPDANWNSSDTFFTNGDDVTFDDSVDTLFAGTVLISENPQPGSITLNNTIARSYAFSGGSIGGSGGLVKNNDGIVTLGFSNTFTGGTTVNAGELVLDAGNSSRPTGTGPLTINTGGTVTCGITVNGHNQLGNHNSNNVIPLIINGGTWNPSAYTHFNSLTMTGGNVSAGLSAEGDGLDLRNSGSLNPTITTLASTNSATIAAKATFGNAVFFAVADGVAAIDLAYSGNMVGTSGFEKLGDGCMFLSGVNTYEGTTKVSGGCLAIEDISAIPGNLAQVSVAAGAGFGGIVGASNLSDGDIAALAANVQWDAGGTAQLILDTNGSSVNVGGNFAGLGFQILAKGGGTLNLSGNVTGITVTAEAGTTVTYIPGGAANISVVSIITSAGTNPGTRKTSIAFTADGDVDVYASNDLSNWGAPIATGVPAAATPFVEDNIPAGNGKRFYVLVTAGKPYPAP